VLGEVFDRVVGVQAARIRQHPERNAVQALDLATDGLDSTTKSSLVRATPENRDSFRPRGRNQSMQPRNARDQFFVSDFVGASGRTIHEIRDSDPASEQVIVLIRAELPISEARPVQGWPEPVARGCEVQARRTRARAGIDADEENSKAVGNEVWDGFADALVALASGHRPAWQAGLDAWTRHDTPSSAIDLADLTRAKPAGQGPPCSAELGEVWPGKGEIYSQRLSAQRTKSRLGKIVGTAAYKSMTIRSWATTVALLERVEAPATVT
jgi:hypothetical protein